jgi:hypothetical protein
MDYQELIKNGKPVIQSKIDGNFEGFNDSKLFPLYNKQYWLQKRYKYWYHYSYMAQITIYGYQNRFYLTKDGKDKCVEVQRLHNVIKATVINDFNGWSGDTIFELDNGQVWKQDEYDYDYNYSHRPTALIYSDGYSFRIHVEGKSIEVKQLK